MNKRFVFGTTGIAAALMAASLLVGCGGFHGNSNSSGSHSSRGVESINHIIFMAQENRSFDVYFGKLNDYRAANGLPTDVDGLPADASNPAPDGTPIPAFHLKTMCIENTSASWGASHIDFNSLDPGSDTPRMDGFAIAAAGSANFAGLSDTQGIRAMGYYDGNDLVYHHFLASQFGTSDRWFAAAPVETQPNRLYMMAATSAGHAHTPPAPLTGVKTIFDLLEAKGISWKVYISSSISGTTLNFFQPFASQHQDNIVTMDQYYTDLQNNTLPAVAFIEPGFAESVDEHPGIGTHIQAGVAFTEKIINALMTSGSWKDSVFILTFDEHGGLYDHVPSPTNVPNPDGIKPMDLFTDGTEPPGDFNRYGFRVPLIVVSPFSKPHYVSHNFTDFTAWLKLVETRFGLPNLNKRDAAAIDMTEFFDFDRVPWATPPTPPQQPTNGPCYDGLP